MPQYVAPGMLVFGGPGVLKAARFDLARGDVVSEVVPVVERVATPSEYAANYDVAGNGMLVYIAGIDTVGTGAQRSLVWVTPDGREEPLRLDARAFVDPRIGIDDRQVVVELNDAPDDVWTVDVTRGALTRQTFEEGEDETPAWMPDGKTLVYASTRTGVSRAVFRRRSDGGGTEEQLWSGNEHVHVETPTPDGKSLILSASASNGGQTDLMLLPLETKRDWQPLLQTRFNEFGARLSPDGRWMAYTSDESGRLEVYVRAFPTLENKVQVSTTGGQEPIWSRRGDAVYFRSNEGVMAASVRVQGSTVSVGQSRKLFDNKYFLKGGSHTGYDVARDGRFLMVKAGTVLDGNVLVRPVLNVVLNWPTELESRIK
jgi:dipeptidyl aminopeptidase/acylaminoacyl peptidase